MAPTNRDRKLITPPRIEGENDSKTPIKPHAMAMIASSNEQVPSGLFVAFVSFCAVLQ